MRNLLETHGIFLFVFLIGTMCAALRAESHALDPESVDRHAEITLTGSRLVVIYELLLGINPTNRAVEKLDANQDKTISDEERDAYLKEIAPIYADMQTVQLGEMRLPLRFVQGDVYRTIGHNGINVLKIDLGYMCDLPAGIPREATLAFHYHDANLENRNGWKQIRFNPLNGVRYSGHIPYKDFGKFDYTIMETKGFAPKTDEISLEISLPASSEASSSPAVVLPEKREIDVASIRSGVDLLVKIWLALGGIGVILSLVVWRIRRSR
ncbi:MAG: hypothetical protein JXR73_17940 [Candidatus Omnitrophica bacterium]|nr:hypothetical protein [Candidatus Omnitrophota bacterium]